MRLIEIVLMTLAGVWQGIRQDWNLLELALIAAGVWAWRKHWWRPKLRAFPTPRRPWAWALAIVFGALAARLALLPLMPVPIPVVTDEFSHLLLADTFLHGRLANPTHPFWPFFESIHIIQRPHYGSDYFPGHAAVLALGKLLLGSLWAGVLAESTAFLLLLYWALRGWMPPRWALFGILLAALRFSIGSYWVNAYHGGFLPAAGGALVAGAFPRLRRQVSLLEASLFGCGLAILASTRPFEGFFYSLPFLGMLAWHYRTRATALARIALPAAVPVALALAGLGFYFQHVTGTPWVTAYQINQKTYGWPLGFTWKTAPSIKEPNAEFQRYYDFEAGELEKVNTPAGMAEYLTFRLQEYWRFFLGPVLSIPLIMLGRVWRRRRMLIAGVFGGLFAILLEAGACPHYLAPATAMIVAVLVECCRYLGAARPRVVALLPLSMAVILGLRIGAETFHLPYTQALNFQSWCCRVEGDLDKARITAELDRQPGSHLVFVQAKTDPANIFQWIYNSADIDGSRIVWARDLGPERDAQLAAYFGGRSVWVVNPNVAPATLTAWQGGQPEISGLKP